jgi:hypothetical protein
LIFTAAESLPLASLMTVAGGLGTMTEPCRLAFELVLP